MEKFETMGISDTPDGPKKIKVLIKLKKSKDFDQLYQEYEATNKREEAS
jgi:hypothetical protein